MPLDYILTPSRLGATLTAGDLIVLSGSSVCRLGKILGIPDR